MNKPVPRPVSDADIGPLDEHGQQILSPADAASLALLIASRTYRADIAAGLASVARGDRYTTEAVLAELARRRAVR